MELKRILTNLTSRKFLTALVVQIASICAIFAPELESQVADAGMRIVGLVVLLVAGLGYGAIEAGVDKAKMPANEPAETDRESTGG